ncbi:pseudouridine synthase [Taibaiella koreensis]|uniref:pseudouridine synthase n=1 Tax=Taibaiella koreensis TaxID=1268548 RepID=UPI000E59D9A2|nr:pseudouridine synthase [Taibaiella koreensis]
MAFDYYLFYKPFQVLSQFSPEGDKKTLRDFLTGIKKDVYPVGRLDYDSEGLLLLTNDKQLNHQLLNPLFVHEREYWVQVEGVPDEAKLHALRKGTDITVDGKAYHTRPAAVHWLQPEPVVPERYPPIRFRQHIPTSWLSLRLTEGKNRQVRKMTASVGLPTLRLIRYSIGSVTLDQMRPGEYIKTGTSIRQRLLER